MSACSKAIPIPTPFLTPSLSPSIGCMDRWEREVEIEHWSRVMNGGVSQGGAMQQRNFPICLSSQGGATRNTPTGQIPGGTWSNLSGQCVNGGITRNGTIGQNVFGGVVPLSSHWSAAGSMKLPMSCGAQSYLEQNVAPYMTCAVAMPMDIEMFKLASSPPVFGSSLFSQRACMTSRCSARPRSLRIEHGSMSKMKYSAKCLRPCLVVKPEVTSPESASPPLSPDVLLSPGKSKKKVIFADDRGQPLTQVKVMTEPSDCPPRWTSEFLDQVTKGVLAEVASERWEFNFQQPAADYLEFKNRLESQNVCLENVFLSETGSEVTGTVKVKNLFFHKEVFVRVTFDQWKSFRDVRAKYVPVGTASNLPHLIDTFTFSIEMPRNALVDRMDFCIQFKCEGCEFWDNNCGKNYGILRASKKPQPAPVAAKRNSQASNIQPVSDAMRMRLDSWSEFASWSHFDTAGPYW